MNLLAGIHPVREALRAARPLDRILIAKGASTPRLQEIVELARAAKIPLRFEPRQTLDRIAKTIPHQGVIAYSSAQPFSTLEGVLPNASLIVVLDGVEDPHNLGAIVRTAHAAGASAVVIPDRRAAGLTETVAKAAAGAISLIPIVKVPNLNRALDSLKQAGFWIYGLDHRATQLYSDTDFTNPAAIVLGGEGHGLHDLTRRHCDFLLRIPMAGQVASLNVSVAAGIVLFDWRRRQPPAP
ncbi:MAG: 23S rRNA (guanosine(2251)-2'-O)-methyltransferase RlmB [Candidatus Solibacter usitatus]|nr:23S rRNA (guanosine(2251)-2'-O)-methyltransferase RlmB [Candidatus Solibacter usitatus]